MNRPRTRANYAERLARVAAHIARHLDSPLDIERLASIACLSPFHFHRIYSAMIGETVGETVRRCRLQRAARHLVDTQRPIARIARAAGYASVAAFARAFAGAHGLPPAAFRRRCAAAPARGPNILRKGEAVMNHAVTIENLPERRLIAVRLAGSYAGIGDTFCRLRAWTEARGLAVPDAQGFAIYLNDCFDVPVETLLTDVCLSAPPQASGEGDVRVIDLPGGRHAVLHHQGPYTELGAAYRWLYGDWLPRSGEDVADRPAFDTYLNDPRSLPPAQWRTDLCLPLAAR
jgi:AraC family transcriptional regulator